MTNARQTPTNPAWRMAGLASGVGATVALFAIPAGIVDYLLVIAVGAVAVLIGHRAVRRAGPAIWMGITGLTLAYLTSVVAVGLLTVRLLRLFTS